MKIKTIIIVLIAFVGCLMLAQDAPRGFMNPADVVAMTTRKTSSSGSTLTNDLIAYYSFDTANPSNDVVGVNNYHMSDIGSFGTGIVSGIITNGITNYASAKYYQITEATAPLLDLTNNFTVSAWVKLSSTATPSGLFTKYASSGNQRQYVLDFQSTSLGFEFYCSQSLSAYDTNYSAFTLAAPSTGIWYNLVGINSNNVIYLVVNGSNWYTSISNTACANGTANIIIGSYSGGVNPLRGVIDDVAIWSRVLTSTEVLSVYQNGTNGIGYKW